MKKSLVLLFAPVFLIGCKENSALSDVELTNPKLITPEITLTQQVNERGRQTTELVVFLNDKNNNSIDLLKGNVDLNGKALGVHSEIGGAPYYTRGNIELIPNRKYNFNIHLADDKSYSCFVNSPKQTLTKFDVPEYHNINLPLLVSWDELNSTNTSYTLEMKNDVAVHEYTLRSGAVQSGSHVISSTLLTDTFGENRTDLVLTLRSVTQGETDPKFDGGSIKIIQSISKQITLGEGNDSLASDESLRAYIPK